MWPFKNLRIFSKLILAILIVGISLTMTGLMGYYHTHKQSQNMERMYEQQVVAGQDLNDVRVYLVGIHFITTELVLERNETEGNKQLQIRLQELLDIVDKKMASYMQGTHTTAEMEKLTRAKALIQTYHVYRQNTLGMSQKGQVAEATQYLNQTLLKQLEKSIDVLNEICADNVKVAAQMSIDSQATARNSEINLLLMTGMEILLLLLGGWVLARNLTQRIAVVGDSLREISEGNLTKDIKIAGEDEIGLLGKHLQVMQDQLKHLVMEISQNAHQVESAIQDLAQSATIVTQASSLITAASMQVTEGAEKQLLQLDSTVATAEVIGQNVQETADNAHKINIAAAQGQQAVLQGVASVQQSIRKMEKIHGAVALSAERIEKLGRRSEEIELIVDTISGIASQTNLLALNAAIEAAHAGDMGKGFAVVAEEVRKLAEQSQNSAKQIATLIMSIQAETTAAVEAIGEGMQEVVLGHRMSEETGEFFQEISDKVETVVKEFNSSTLVMDQISLEGARINENLKQFAILSRSTTEQSQEIAATTEEQSASLEELTALSESLRNLMHGMQQSIAVFRM